MKANTLLKKSNRTMDNDRDFLFLYLHFLKNT